MNRRKDANRRKNKQCLLSLTCLIKNFFKIKQINYLNLANCGILYQKEWPKAKNKRSVRSKSTSIGQDPFKSLSIASMSSI